MSVNLGLLVWSCALLALYIGVQGVCYQLDYGLSFGASARDDARPPGIFAGRAQRALSNFLQTFGIFIALSVALELSGRADGVSLWGGWLYLGARIGYLPLYLLGIAYWRSVAWTLSVLGLVLMFYSAAI